MTPRAALLLPLFGLALATACDNASVYEDCDKPEKEGTGEARCFPSRFAKEDPRAREAAGFVSIGTERVPNTLVSLDGTPLTTDSAGIYRLRDTPFFYDVAVRIDDEVVGVHSAARRVLDIALDREVPAKGFSGKVELVVEGSRAGHRLAVFVSGANVVGLAGSLQDGLIVSSRVYENDKVKLHVVEYPETGGLENAVAKGNVDVRVRGDTATIATVSLDPITERKTVTLKAVTDATGGFAAIEDLDLMVDMGIPVSRMFIRKIRIDEKIELPVIELGKDERGEERQAGWLLQGKATRADGSFASIGLRPIRPGDEVTLTYYAPPAAERNEGSVLWAKSAQGRGAFEHVLVPISGADGRQTIRIFSAKPNTPVPDLQSLGLPAARGEYRWTVRAFPDWAFVDDLPPLGNRLYRSSSTSSPRTITLP